MQLSDGQAAQNVPFVVYRAPSSLVQTGLSGAEEIPVQVYNGIDYQQLLDSDGNAVKLTATVKNLVLSAAGSYQLAVPVTAARTVVVFSQNAE